MLDACGYYRGGANGKYMVVVSVFVVNVGEWPLGRSFGKTAPCRSWRYVLSDAFSYQCLGLLHGI